MIELTETYGKVTLKIEVTVDGDQITLAISLPGLSAIHKQTGSADEMMEASAHAEWFELLTDNLGLSKSDSFELWENSQQLISDAVELA